MAWVGGQVNLTPEGVVLNPGNLAAQTDAVMDNINSVLAELGCDLADLVNLNCFYVNDGREDEAAFIQQIAKSLPANTCTAITLIPVPALAYDNMLVEIEAVAMRAKNGNLLPRTYADPDQHFLGSEKFCSAVRCGKMIFISAQSPIGESASGTLRQGIVEQTRTVAVRLQSVLRAFGA